MCIYIYIILTNALKQNTEDTYERERERSSLILDKKKLSLQSEKVIGGFRGEQ